MIDIQFKVLKIRNFMSIDMMDIDFSKYKGITFITGKNYDDDSDNGVGKTTISNALWYCLSGESPNKTKLSDIPNRKTGHKVFSTELEYSVGSDHYKIVRSSKKVEFFVNGEDVTKTNTSTNEDILKSFTVDKMTLYQTLLVSVDGDLSFFDKSSSDKIKYIESVLNLKVFEKLFEDAKKTFNELKKKKDQLEISGEYLKKDITRNETEYSTFSEKNLKKVEALNSQINNNIQKLNDLKIPIVKIIDDFMNKKAKVETQLRTCDQQIAVFNNNIKKDIKELSDLEKMLDCPTCGKPFDDIHSKKSKIQELDGNIQQAKKELVEWDQRRVKHQEQFRKALEYEDKIRLLEKVQNDRKSLEDLVVKYRKDINVIEAETNPFDNIVQTKKQELGVIEDQLKTIKKDCKIYETLKYVYSPEGVKNHIIKKIINLFNDILKNILIELHSPFKLTFDEYFEETIIHDKNEIAYGTMSRGEKARIMLAIVFTFRELRRLQTGFSLNISFYDEIFDTGLCKNGMTRCLEILEKQNKSFVITHRSESIDSSRYGRIDLFKKNGITSIKKE
jgi:DNA repair exonuclease SbcCD ATPase subunit